LWSSQLWHHAVLVVTSFPPTRLHSVTTQKTIHIFTIIKTPNLTSADTGFLGLSCYSCRLLQYTLTADILTLHTNRSLFNQPCPYVHNVLLIIRHLFAINYVTNATVQSILMQSVITQLIHKYPAFVLHIHKAKNWPYQEPIETSLYLHLIVLQSFVACDKIPCTPFPSFCMFHLCYFCWIMWSSVSHIKIFVKRKNRIWCLLYWF
jgi:hypothetical protein